MADYILITGGNGGIGRTIVERFLRAGFNVISLDVKDDGDRPLIYPNSITLTIYKVDLCDFASLEGVINDISGRNYNIKHFISLAGGAMLEEFGGIDSSTVDIIEGSIKINLTSHIVLSRIIKHNMSINRSTNKTITFISSINAVMDFGLPAYSAAKSGLIGLTKVLASELGGSNIRVNSVLPGTVVTRSLRVEPKLLDKYTQGTLLNRFASGEDIAEVVFCLSEKMTCITGQTIIADCGQTVKGRYENTYFE